MLNKLLKVYYYGHIMLHLLMSNKTFTTTEISITDMHLSFFTASLSVKKCIPQQESSYCNCLRKQSHSTTSSHSTEDREMHVAGLPTLCWLQNKAGYGPQLPRQNVRRIPAPDEEPQDWKQEARDYFQLLINSLCVWSKTLHFSGPFK